jgi:hypothetical protein
MQPSTGPAPAGPRVGIVRVTTLPTGRVLCGDCGTNPASCLVYPVGLIPHPVCPPCHALRYTLLPPR